MPYYSIHWERVDTRKNVDEVRITFLDEQGRARTLTKTYPCWIGVCTGRIEKLVEAILRDHPQQSVTYQRMGDAKKVLPYFDARLARGKLAYRSKPFYKLFTTACIKTLARNLAAYKLSYYGPEDCLVRLYVDLCARHDCHAFYYRWYEVDEEAPALLDSLRMLPGRNDAPDWTLAAFDLESVPLVGGHVPMGYRATDRVVMASLYKWNRREGPRTWILYLLPDGIDRPLEGYEHGFRTESELLVRLHELLDDAHLLTGYNVHAFDFRCLFARLLWLGLNPLVARYTSRNVGTDLVVSYRGKPSVDLYAYFKTFSGYDLPSFKLDDVARVKLAGEAKLPLKATGLWSWYRRRGLTRDLFEEASRERCFEALRPPEARASEFGTFRDYLDYCLRDSELVYRLFEKETVLSFLVERANFTALHAVEALHLGNSRYLLELFRTYGTRLGYFVNPRYFRPDDARRPLAVGAGRGGTYQGALNFCQPERVYEDVSVMDFASMYPSALLSSNLCYGTCTLMGREEWLQTPAVHGLVAIPYRQHDAADFERGSPATGPRFAYPPFDPERDPVAIVVNRDAEAFLPRIVAHFVEMRRHHQRRWKEGGDVYHYNVQLGIKILVNSLYGVMASRDSPLAYLPVAAIIVTLARYQLLGSYHFLRNRGYDVCYADTDSLMVHRWPEAHCDAVNAFLGLPHVELKFEQRLRRLVVLSKKRYVYEAAEGGGGLVTKGFQKKVNGLIAFMSGAVLERVWRALYRLPDPVVEGMGEVAEASRGWIAWVDILLEAQYRCRDPKKYAIYRKIKKLEEYTSLSCPSVKYLRKYPERRDEHVEFTYSRADVAATEVSNWVTDVEDCRWVNYEQLFVSQRKIFGTLLNMAFWHLPDPSHAVDMVLNAIHWKRFVLAELLHWHRVGRRRVALLVEPGVRYTFCVNDHVTSERRAGRKRKIVLGLD